MNDEKTTALDEKRRREPEHPPTCSPGWCLVKPLISDGHVWTWDGYHRSAVQTIEVEWGLAIQVGVGQPAENSEPVVHLRSLETDCNGELPYDIVMSPTEALALSVRLAETATAVRREITQWQEETGGAR